LLNPNDPGHRRAHDRSKQTQRVVTTEYVLLELGNALSPPAWRSRMIALADVLRSDAAVTLVPASADLLDRLRQPGVQAMHLYPFEAIVEQLETICRDGDLLVIMGAGPVWKVAKVVPRSRRDVIARR
jgi:hypothetical protein